MKRVNVPEEFNYIACFLTLRCNYDCPFCLNRFNGKVLPGEEMSGEKWIAGLNRLDLKKGLPLTLEGGEPGLHRDFFRIIRGIDEDKEIDILTNLTFDLGEFIGTIPPDRLNREAPYANIRVSYYPLVHSLEEIARRVAKLNAAGFKAGLYGIDHPLWKREIEKAEEYCRRGGIDFRTKDFLGFYEGKLHGNYLYEDACLLRERKKRLCRIKELIIGPDGSIFRCHADLYGGGNPVGHILDDDLAVRYEFRECGNYGHCHPCDLKVKTNRFQEYGHTSVQIKEIQRQEGSIQTGGE